MCSRFPHFKKFAYTNTHLLNQPIFQTKTLPLPFANKLLQKYGALVNNNVFISYIMLHLKNHSKSYQAKTRIVLRILWVGWEVPFVDFSQPTCAVTFNKRVSQAGQSKMLSLMSGSCLGHLGSPPCGLSSCTRLNLLPSLVSAQHSKGEWLNLKCLCGFDYSTCHFYYIISIKTNHKNSLDSSGGETVPTSCWEKLQKIHGTVNLLQSVFWQKLFTKFWYAKCIHPSKDPNKVSSNQGIRIEGLDLMICVRLGETFHV